MTSQFPVDAKYLKSLDDVRDEDSASSHNYLNSHLSYLCHLAQMGFSIRLEQETGDIVLTSPADVENWALGRYPSAELLHRRTD